MSIIDWLAKREFKRQAPKRRLNYPGWIKAQKVGIYFEVNPMTIDDWHSWKKAFEAEGKEVHLLSFQSVKRKELASDWDVPTYCKDEKSWLGFPRASSAKDFIKEEFDVLIDLSSSDDLCHEAIFRDSHAKLKVAFSPKRKAWSDLQVNCKDLKNTRACQEEIVALLKFINA